MPSSRSAVPTSRASLGTTDDRAEGVGSGQHQGARRSSAARALVTAGRARAGGFKLAIAACLGLGLLVVALRLPLDTLLLELAERFQRAGPLGVVAYGLAYTPGALLLLPSAAFTLGAGFAYGALGGILLAIPAATLSSAVVFAVSRTLLRGEVERRFAHRPLFRAIDRAVSRHGLWTVVLLRLSPITPFNVLNYAFGLTRIKLRHYVLASLIGVTPGAVFYASLGAAITSAAAYARGDRPSAGPMATVLYGVGLLATFVVVVVLGRLASRELERQLDDPELGPEPHDGST